MHSETVRELFLHREGPSPDGPRPLPVAFSGPLAGYRLCWHPAGDTTVLTNARDASVAQMRHTGDQTLKSLTAAVVTEMLADLLSADDGTDVRAILGLSKEQAANLAQFIHLEVG